MNADKNFNVVNGPNLKFLDAKGFDRIVFGCPPSIVKHFKEIKEELPARYVLPESTFMKGSNNFDFEFIVYSFLFVRSKKEKIVIYCTKDQRDRFKIILCETLFGPKMVQLLQAEFRKFESKQNYTKRESGQFHKFLKYISDDKKLKGIVQDGLQNLLNEQIIIKSLKERFTVLLGKNKSLIKKNKSDLISIFAKVYFFCAQLKSEIDLFTLAKEDMRDVFIDELVDFQLFSYDKSVTVEGNKDKRQKLKITQPLPANFDIYQKNQLKCQIDMAQFAPPAKPKNIEFIVKPFMGTTFVGVGSGFTHKLNNSCTLIWMEGKGILIDAFSEHNEVLLNYGIAEGDIEFMILTHVHSDHDSGFVERVLSGQRCKILSTRIIFESFLRKLSAIACFPEEVLEGFLEFIELLPNKKTKLPGFDNTWIKLGYALHSIPTVKLTLSYVDKNGKESSISHSGDTKYDVDLVHNWHKQGAFSKKRRDDILGFIWDADMIIHEVGGGLLHTEFSSLTHLDDSIAKKLVLIHQNRDPVKHPKFSFAREGETKTLIKGKNHNSTIGIESIQDIVLFKNLSPSQLQSIIQESEVVKLKPDQIIFSQNEIGDSFYVLLNGFAQVIVDGNKLAHYEKGMFFGELAVSTPNPRRRATIKTITKSTLLKIPNEFYREFNLPEIQDEFYKLGNFFHDVIGTRLKGNISPDLIASLGFGKIVHWNKYETIFPHKGDCKEIYVILSGDVVIEDTKGNIFCTLFEGDILGNPSNMKNAPKHSTATVSTDKVFAVRLNQKQVKRMFKLFPSFYGTVYQRLKKIDS
jgi:CRP-like cAMP-binding protein